MTVKKILFILLTTLFSTAFITACGDLGYEPNDSEEVSATLIEDEVNNDVPSEISQPDEQVNPNRKVLAGGKVLRNTSHDWSGDVETKIWSCTGGYLQSSSVSCSVDSGYVVIGGGADTIPSSGSGALLTMSKPSSGLYSWSAKSKAHLRTFPHNLRVYVIGLKLNRMSSVRLKRYMKVVTARSPNGAHPETFARLPQGYSLVGGGAYVNYYSGPGNFLVYSYPAEDTWYVKSKDHVASSPAYILAYAIGIKPYIPGFGKLDIDRIYHYGEYVNTGHAWNYLTAPSDWLLACPGAKSEYYNNLGRLFTDIYPISGRTMYARTKDHIRVDPGRITGYAMMIRKNCRKKISDSCP